MTHEGLHLHLVPLRESKFLGTSYIIPAVSSGVKDAVAYTYMHNSLSF